MKKTMIALLFASPAFSFAQQLVTQAPVQPQLHLKSGKALKATGAVFIGTGLLVMAIGAVSSIGSAHYSFNEPAKQASNSSSTIVGIGAGMVAVGFPMYFIGSQK